MKKIRFESENGYSIEFTESEKGPYIFGNLDGNGLVGESNTLKIPGKDGKTTYDITHSQRNIEFEGAIISAGSKIKWMKQVQAENRDYAARCFDPGYFGTLYYYAYHGDPGKKIRCKPTGLPAFEPDFNNLVKFRLGFESDGSAWEKVETLYASLGMTRNNFRFPLFIGAPSAFSYISARAVIHNSTLYNISPRVEVYNSILPVHVVNENTGAFLKFKVPTGINCRLTVDVKNAAAILEERIADKWVYKENVIHYLSPDSRLTDFIIAPGENEFKVIAAESQAEKPVLVITANEPVMGV